jgi:endonuclease G
MKPLKFLLISISLTTLLFSSTTQSNNIYYGNEAPDIINSKLTPKTKELCYSTFAVLHSGISRTPLYVGEHLTRAGLSSHSERTNDFHSEERLPSDERAELNDNLKMNKEWHRIIAVIRAYTKKELGFMCES